MKNFKRLVAAAMAATMVMGVSAFAEVEVKDAVNASYAAGAATTAVPAAKDGTQMTVVIFDASKQLANLKGEDLLYINQDEEGKLSLTSMGTKIDLLEAKEDGTAKYAGKYIIRVGYYNESNVWSAAEGTFTVATKAAATPDTITVKWGDVNKDGSYNVNDSGAILNSLIGGTNTFDGYKIGEVFVNTLKWGDVNNDTTVNVNDSGAILNSLVGGTQTYGDYTLGTDEIITIVAN